MYFFNTLHSETYYVDIWQVKSGALMLKQVKNTALAFTLSIACGAIKMSDEECLPWPCERMCYRECIFFSIAALPE